MAVLVCAPLRRLSASCQHTCLAMPCAAARRLHPVVRMSWDDVVRRMVLESCVWWPHSLHTAEVTGSIPVTPTSTNSLLDLALGACQKICQETTLSRRENALSAARIEGSRQVRADPLPPKPDRPSWSPATAGNGGGRGRGGVVRDRPLGTSQDRCERHGSGTVGEDDVREAWPCGHQLDRRVRLDPSDACLVGKGRRPVAGVGAI